MVDTSLGTLLTGLIHDLGQLVRQDLRLAQSEAGEKFKQAQNGVYAVLTGLLVAFCALLILLQALVIALSNVLPPWLAAVAVGLVLAVVAFFLIHQGRSNLKARNLIPERTLRSAQRTRNLKET